MADWGGGRLVSLQVAFVVGKWWGCLSVSAIDGGLYFDWDAVVYRIAAGFDLLVVSLVFIKISLSIMVHRFG